MSPAPPGTIVLNTIIKKILEDSELFGADAGYFIIDLRNFKEMVDTISLELMRKLCIFIMT